MTHHYDAEADVLYLSFGHSEQVTTVELSDYLLLRLDPGRSDAHSPRAIGLTLLFPARLLQLGHRPMALDLARLRHLPATLQDAVLDVLSSPPVSELLSTELAFTPDTPALATLLAA